MKSLFLFGWTVLLFIICCPGVILEPYKYKLFGLLIHGFIFTILYVIMYKHMSNVVEGLETDKMEDTKDKFEEAKEKLSNKLKEIDIKAIIKDEGESARLAGFASSLLDEAEVFVHKDEVVKAKAHLKQ